MEETVGVPAETQAQSDGAISTTALKSSGIAHYTATFGAPRTQREMQGFAAYVESLRIELVRS